MQKAKTVSEIPLKQLSNFRNVFLCKLCDCRIILCVQQLLIDDVSTDSEAESESFQENSPTAAKFLYRQTGDTATITGYTGKDEVLVIPSKIDGFQVTAISDSAFQSQTLKNVIVADGITKIGWFAFRDCPSISSVTIPQSVKSIGYSAFPPEGTILTLYCHADSFAQKYAQSYGIRHTII